MAKTPDAAHSLQLSELLDSQREASSLTDVVLICGGKDFPAHKIILSATSNYFRAMFASGWDENGKGRIELPTVGAEEMAIILPFLYTGCIKTVDNPSVLKTLLKTSHLLGINALFDYSCQELRKKLSSRSFLEIYKMAEEYDQEGMMASVLSFLIQHFTAVAASKEFLNLNAGQLQKIIQHPDIHKVSLDEIIKGLLRWAKVEDGREDTLLHFLTNLDLKGVSKGFLMQLLRERSLVKKNLHILTLLTAEATSRLLVTSEDRPKLFCFGNTNEKQVLNIYDIIENRWLESKTPPFNLEACMSVISFRGHIYVLGGGNVGDFIPSDKIIKYDPSTNQIVSTGTLVTPVCQAGVGMLQDCIYVVDGLDHVVQRYNPTTRKCKQVANTVNTYNRPHVLNHANYLYVLGSTKGYHNSVEIYDPEYNEWTVLTEIPGEIVWCSAAIVQEKLYVMLTHTTNEFQVYDFVTGKWTEKKIKDPLNKMYILHTLTVESKPVLFIRDSLNKLHSYDPESNHWLTKSAANQDPWNLYLTCVHNL